MEIGNDRRLGKQAGVHHAIRSDAVNKIQLVSRGRELMKLSNDLAMSKVADTGLAGRYGGGKAETRRRDVL